MNFYRNAAGLLATSVATLLAGLCSSILLARLLTEADRGMYAIALELAALVSTLAQLGWPAAAVYRIRGQEGSAGSVVTTSLIGFAVLSSLVIGACAAFQPQITSGLAGLSPSVFLTALFMVPALMLGVFMENAARAIDRFGLGNRMRVAQAATTLLTVAVVLGLFRADAAQMLLAYLVVQTIFALGLAWAVARVTGLGAPLRLGEAVPLLRFGLANHVTGLAGRVHERVDILMIAWLVAEPTQVAFYAIAVSIVNRMKVVTEALANAAFPQMAGLDEREAGRFACQVCRQTLLWVVPMAAGIAICAPALVPWLFGASYRASVTPLLILLPAMIGLSIYRVLFRFFLVRDRQGVNIAVQYVSLGLNVGLNLWLIPRHGILGAATASLISYSFEGALIALLFARSSGWAVRAFLIPTGADFRAYARRARAALQGAATPAGPAT